MTRTHNGHCGSSAVIQWTTCSCICAGREHPGYAAYYLLVGAKSKGGRWTAVPAADGVEPDPDNPLRLDRVLLGLALDRLTPQAQQNIGTKLCKIISEDFVLTPVAKKVAPTGVQIALRQQPGQTLLQFAKAGAAGAAAMPDPRLSKLFSALPALERERTAAYLALLLCGYLHDTNAFPIVREATSQLFKPLLRARVFGLGRAGSLQTLSTNLAQDVTFERFVQNAIASLGIGGARPNDICSTLQFIASTLATCGAVDTAAVTVKDAVKAARGREAARYSVAAEGLSNYLWTLFPTGPSVPAMLAITRLLALVAFPDPERRPTILENCLKPLVTELNHVRLSPDLQYELREIVAAA